MKQFPKMPIPQVLSDFYPMRGGLDQMSPALTLDPGKVFDASNYATEISGGYKRINGFERSDGRPSPTAASYWVMSVTVLAPYTVGATVTGATSAATGRVLGTFGTVLVMSRVTGTFVIGENLTIAAAIKGKATSAALMNGASLPSDDADYKQLAANDFRADILVVPGSGPIRGVHTYNDITYAFRDNAGATAGGMWKQTAGGWVAIAFGTEIQFTTAVGEIFAADAIVGGTSGATAVVVRPMLRTGTWGVAGAGTLIIAVTSGAFISGETIKVGGVTKVTSSSASTAIARLPGGRVEAITANFTGSILTRRMYGADGMNLAFEFDGTNYIPIRTGMATDTPLHVAEHKNRLFLTFQASLQYSSATSPYAWSVVVGAGEITTGAAISGIVTLTGNGAGASLGVFTTGKTFVLYGSSNTDFSLVPSTFDLGYNDYTFQPVGNNVWGLTARGIQSVITTLDYGDFEYTALSFLIQTLLTAKLGMQVSSVTNKSAAQYRLFFNDGTGVVLGLTGDKPNGCMPLNYGKVVRCIHSTTLSTGQEVTYFGSDDGYVYKDNTGTSFDGSPIEAWIRPVFNNVKSPQLRKQFLRAFFEVKADGYGQVQVSNDMGYADPDINPSEINAMVLVGAGGYWDQVTWDNFTYDTQVVATPQISVDGTDTNIAFLFYSNRAQDLPLTVQGVNIYYIPRRLARGS